MKLFLSIIFIFVFSFIVFGQDLPESATFTVTNLNDSGAGSLRQAINDAGLVAGDDTINFQSDLSGAIALTSGELLINSNVTISGTSSSITITRSTAAETPSFRILNIASGATVSINNLTISGGKLTNIEAQGGGIYNAGILSVSNTTVSNNLVIDASGKGGGIYNTGSIFFSNSNVSNNFAGCMTFCSTNNSGGAVRASGGGLYNTGSFSFTNSSINDNVVGCYNNDCHGANSYAEGGGITNAGAINMTNSTVSSNQSLGSTCSLSCNGSSKGGGILNSQTGTASLANSTIRDNIASGTQSYGGGIYNSNTLSVTNTSVISNSATVSGGSQSLSGGGGIFSANQLIVTNSTVSNNKSAASNQQYGAKGGSGIYGGGTLRNSTVSGNSHRCYSCYSTYDYDRQGGAIGGGLTISNTIVASNTLFGINSPFDVTGQVNSEGYNLIGNVGTSSGWLSTDILNRDARLAPLADNGGPTQTQALLPDSPAINAGNNADAPATDQRGFARIVGGIIDIGAFESATTCDFTINPTNQFISSFGGNITVNVTGAASCSRTGVSTLEWISVTSGSSGSGNGTVTISIQANTGSARTGTVTIAGQTFTVNQSSGCTFSLSSTSSALIPSTGGGGTFDILSGAGCAYTASTTDTWITIDGSVSGTGSGTISYIVAANTGAARTGTITVGGQIFTINQAAFKSRKRVRFIS